MLTGIDLLFAPMEKLTTIRPKEVIKIERKWAIGLISRRQADQDIKEWVKSEKERAVMDAEDAMRKDLESLDNSPDEE